MATTTIAALKKKHNRRGNVRKGLNAVAFLAPTTVDLPDELTDAGGQLKELPAGWLPVGLLTKDGMAFSADASVEEVEALGYVESVRTDLVKAPKTVKFSVLEPYRKHLQQLVYGVDLSQVKANKDTGEIVFDEAPLPLLEEFRLLTIMSDGPADDEWLVGRGFPRVVRPGPVRPGALRVLRRGPGHALPPLPGRYWCDQAPGRHRLREGRLSPVSRLIVEPAAADLPGRRLDHHPTRESPHARRNPCPH